MYNAENAPELERFQKRATAMEPGKVKGLFTSVKGTSIERIIALGMGMKGSTKIERERKTLSSRLVRIPQQ